MKRNVCHVLWSGGLDSTAVVLKMLDQGFTVKPVLVHYGQLAFIHEESAVADLRWALTVLLKSKDKARLHTARRIDVVGMMRNHALHTGKGPDWKKKGQEQWFMPHRNLLLLTLASMIAATESKGDIINLAIGSTVREDDQPPFPDCTSEFTNLVQHVLELTAGKSNLVRMFTPLLDEKLKRDDVLRYINTWEQAHLKEEPHDTPGKLVTMAYSCWRSNKKYTPCGTCTRCCETRGSWFRVFGNEGPYA